MDALQRRNAILDVSVIEEDPSLDIKEVIEPAAQANSESAINEAALEKLGKIETPSSRLTIGNRISSGSDLTGLGIAKTQLNNPIAKNDIDSLGKDFLNLKKQTEKDIAEQPNFYFTKEDNYHKTFDDIGCPRKTALSIGEANEKFFLHANRVAMRDGKEYIALCCPWYWPEGYTQLFWEQGGVIIDLTNPNDLKKDKRPESYFPEELNDGFNFEDSPFSVTCDEIERIKSKSSDNDAVKGQEDNNKKKKRLIVTQYSYTIKKEGEQGKDIRRIHFENWPDQQAIKPEAMLELIETIESLVDEEDRLNVHCRAGVGRTGTFITAYTMYQLKKQGLAYKDYRSTLHKVILEGRMQRGENFVQTSTQLQSLYEFGGLLYAEVEDKG